MAKRPYIQFYLGDYIKDTRVLPLNVKGGWVDLMLAMWENSPQGELIGCIEDFARIMNCGLEEADLVIQTLKVKKIFDYHELDGCFFKIISRKQKKMLNTSKTRQETGKKGGNPNLLKSRVNQKDNQKVNLNAEYEYESNSVVEGVQGEINTWNFLPGENEMGIPLPEIKAGAATEMYFYTHQKRLTESQLEMLWGIFKKQNFTGDTPYHTIQKTYSHFINWIKTQKINGTDNQSTSKNGKSTGLYQVIDLLKTDLESGT